MRAFLIFWLITLICFFSVDTFAADTFSVTSSPTSSTVDTSTTDNIFNTDDSTLRSGDFSYTDIPELIKSVIEYLLLLTGTICIVALIYHAVRMQIASGITGDSSHVDHAKQGMRGAMIGFVLSMSAWFLMTKFVEILTALSGS